MINKELEMIDEDRIERVIKLLTLLDRKDEISLNELNSYLKKFDNVTLKVECVDEEILEAYEELRDERVELLQKCENLKGRLKDKNNEISFLCEVIDALEEEKEELDDECYELEEENAALMQEIKEIKGDINITTKEDLHESLEWVLNKMKNCKKDKVKVDLAEKYTYLYLGNEDNVSWMVRQLQDRGVDEIHYSVEHEPVMGGMFFNVCIMLEIKIPKNFEVIE